MDLYCIVCGCCSWNKFRNSEYEDFVADTKKQAKYIEENNITDERLVKYIETYANIDKYISSETFYKVKKYMEYMDEITILAQNGDIVKNAEWFDGNEYINPNEDTFTRPYYVYQNFYETHEDTDKNFIGAKFIHNDCMRYIKHEFNIDLTYASLCNHIIKYYATTNEEIYASYPPLNIDYGEITKYWSVDYGFLIENIILDNKIELIFSPLSILKKTKENKNKYMHLLDRTNNIIKQIIKKN